MNHTPPWWALNAGRRLALAIVAVLPAVACGGGAQPGKAGRDTLVVYVAASLARPLQPVLDTFAAHTGAVIQRESGASLEHARKITELGRIPDVILLADYEVFPQLLMPAHATWYAQFARNRMVVAYTDRSRHAAEITPENWPNILVRRDVQVGRTDPSLAPAGYRALLLMKLAERHAHRPGLADSLLRNTPSENVRGNAADLAALLAAGELDYIYEYQSVAEANGFRFIKLPSEVDLGDPAHAAEYATAQVVVYPSGPSSNLGMERKYAGQPILYGLSIPTRAPHPAIARQFITMLFSPATMTMLRAGHVDMLDAPVVIGSGAPAEINDAAARTTAR
jgi:molybdate/tungstate transport system substrate-binding protein